MNEVTQSTAVFTNDAIVLGILASILAVIFITQRSEKPFFQKFYTYVPSLLLCYFIPSILNTLGIIDGEASNLYYVASRYLLPTSLVLLTLSIDLKAVLQLGPKAIIMFLAGTTGIVIGGPLAILIVSSFAPDLVGGAGPDAVWRGLATVAGSWIGGGANQAGMLEIFGASPDLFAAMVTVDVLIASIWLAFLLYGAGITHRIDKFFKGDVSAIDALRKKVENYRLSIEKMPTLPDTMAIIGIGFGMTAIAHFGSDNITPWIVDNFPNLDRLSLTSPFFWLISIATALGLGLSFTRARQLEGVGASRIGSLLLYVLVATIGMRMDIMAVFQNPGYFLIGFIWIICHVIILLTVAKIIRAPFFFVAVGSQANIGGAASAPIVASAFHPALAPVGVLLAVVGYALGTYAAWFCGILMSIVAP